MQLFYPGPGTTASRPFIHGTLPIRPRRNFVVHPARMGHPSLVNHRRSDVQTKKLINTYTYWSGAYVLESLPHALYCFLAAPTDFRKVLISSVNTSRDSDTVASIACAFAGALNGTRSISADFKDELEYRPILKSLALELIK